MTKNDFILYLNWVAYAVVGRMAEADDIYRTYPEALARAKKVILSDVKPHKIHRGIVLGEDGLTEIKPDLERTFISFSHDPFMAMHFGDPLPGRGFGFGPFPQLWPPYVDRKRGYYGTGYVIEYLPNKSEILFHYSLFSHPELQEIWISLLSQIGLSTDGESALSTLGNQKEIILLNQGQVFPCTPFETSPEYEKFVKELYPDGRDF